MVTRPLSRQYSATYFCRLGRESGNRLWIAGLCFAFANPLYAESLTARLRSATVVPCEPILVHVRLHLDQALPSDDDARQAALNQFYLRERIEGIIVEGRSVRCRFRLFPVSRWGLVGDKNKDYVGYFRGFPYRFDTETRTNMFYVRPGVYTFMVRRRGVDSTPISLSIRSPQGDERRALEIYMALGVGPCSLMIFEQEGEQEVVDTFRKVAAEYPGTPYGRWATAAIALWDYEATFGRHNNKGGSDVWDPVVSELREASLVFEGKHPWRVKILLKLAAAEALAKHYDKARATIETIRRDFSDGQGGRRAKELLTELIRFEQTEGSD